MDWNINFLFHGPGRHLRWVQLEMNDLTWDPDTTSDRGPFDIRLFSALAEAAVGLERLEILLRRETHLDGTRERPHIAVPDYSWMDPPLDLPDGPLEEYPFCPTEEQVRQMAAYVAQWAANDAETRLQIEQKMKDSEEYRWHVWIRLLIIEDEKRLFGKRLLEILGEFSPTLRTIVVVGTVDTKWMAVVADLMNVTVRGRLVEYGQEEWVVVQPAGFRSSILKNSPQHVVGGASS